MTDSVTPTDEVVVRIRYKRAVADGVLGRYIHDLMATAGVARIVIERVPPEVYKDE